MALICAYNSATRHWSNYFRSVNPSIRPNKSYSSSVNESKAGLLNDTDTTLITVIGSSYTNKNTGYPDALRDALQRNLLDNSIQVPWMGMDAAR